MTTDGLPDYCLILNWGAFRISITSKGALWGWSTALAALGTGALNWHRLLALL